MLFLLGIRVCMYALVSAQERRSLLRSLHSLQPSIKSHSFYSKIYLGQRALLILKGIFNKFALWHCTLCKPFFMDWIQNMGAITSYVCWRTHLLGTDTGGDEILIEVTFFHVSRLRLFSWTHRGLGVNQKAYQARRKVSNIGWARAKWISNIGWAQPLFYY